MRFGTGKEAQAITFNIKEQRMLEKTDSTLKLEKDYSMKLIEVTSREVKIHQRRLKNKVGKIKSHLTIDEIKEFREQENEGRFGPKINTVKVSGAFTIAAAERRLRLGKERRMAAHGILPDGSKAATTKEYQRQQSDRLSKQVPQRRCQSASQYTDTPPMTPATPATPGVASVKLAFHFRDTSSHSCDQSSTADPRKTPKSARSAPGVPSMDVVDAKSNRKPRPSTSVPLGTRREKIPPRCKSSAGYSSHEIIAKDARDRERSEAAGRRLTRAHSFLSDGSIDGALAKGRQEDRRQTLLDMEQLQTLRLLDRKQNFLTQVNQWIKENPSNFNEDQEQMSKIMAVLGHESNSNKSPDSKTTDGKGLKKKKVLQTRNSFHRSPRIRQRQDGPVEVAWKDLNKCRYLRIAEDEIDLSGVVTLAKTQLQMQNAFKKIEDEEEA